MKVHFLIDHQIVDAYIDFDIENKCIVFKGSCESSIKDIRTVDVYLDGHYFSTTPIECVNKGSLSTSKNVMVPYKVECRGHLINT